MVGPEGRPHPKARRRHHESGRTVPERFLGLLRGHREHVQILRDRAPRDPLIAYVAVTVVDAWHRRGVVTALLARLTERALQAGIRRYAVSVAADNRPVVGVLRGSGGLDPSIATPASASSRHRSPFR
jgi:hypothetical protein